MIRNDDFSYRISWTKRKLLRKLSVFFTAIIFLYSFTTCLYASPAGGVVTVGSGTITQSDKTMTIEQTTNKLGINWHTFDIGTGETVTFIQPSSSSVALNRVLGSEASSIYGALNANGKVFLINPNGVLFAPGSQVNVGGLVASALNISDSDFAAGNYLFNGAEGSVINAGNIKASDGGYVVLLGRQVANQGVIIAKKGTVALGAGEAVTLDMVGDGLINLAVKQATVNVNSANNNLIQADGGKVIMTARTADALGGSVVNNNGIIQANSISNMKGMIRLDGGDNGIVANNGTLSAAGENTGGDITLQGGSVQLGSSSSIDASGTTGGTLKVSAFGDLAITNNLSAGSNAKVILRADSTGTGSGTVNFAENGAVALSGSGTAEIYYNPTGYTSPVNYSANVSGGALSAYMLVNTINQLQNMKTNLTGAYALGKDIDASATSGWNSGAGFAPIGGINSFSGNFNGDNHVISNLYIKRPKQNYVGLFGKSTGAIKNIGLANVSVTGNYYTAGLAGINYGSISNSYSTATVQGYMYVGGLVGDNHAKSKVSNSYSSGTVSGTNHVGGLVGGNTYGNISNSYSSSSVNGGSNSQYVGGLVGHNGNDNGAAGGIISNSYSTGSVHGSTGVGGLVGVNSGSISNSYWNITSSGLTTSAGGTGLTSEQMRNPSSFFSWDFVNIWRIYDGYTYPLLKSFLTPLTVTANDYSRTYDGTIGYAGSAGISYSTTPTNSLLGTPVYGGTAQQAGNVGNYAIIPSGLYSNQQGYDIIYVNGVMAINPRPITVAANNASRMYGDANPASGPVSVTIGSLAATDVIGNASLSSTAWSCGSLSRTAS